MTNFNFQDFSIEAFSDSDRRDWFRSTDVCKILGFTSALKAIKTHAPDCFKELKIGMGRPANYLNEMGLYAMIFASKDPKARDFQFWVFSEVLPSIRKDGAYISPDITPVQALQAIDKLSQVADLASPWEKMWSKPVLDVVRKFYGNFCDKTFWWKYIYDFLTAEERCKLDRLNPIDLATKQRKTRIHQWIEGEGEIKARLTEKVNEVQVLLRTSGSRADFEARYQKLLNAFQGELF